MFFEGVFCSRSCIVYGNKNKYAGAEFQNFGKHGIFLLSVFADFADKRFWNIVFLKLLLCETQFQNIVFADAPNKLCVFLPPAGFKVRIGGVNAFYAFPADFPFCLPSV